MAKTIFLASHNRGKLQEFQQGLGEKLCVVSPQTHPITDVAETGLSYIENALIKARHAARLVNLPVIADDSGLSVNALNGAPGIYSARYAGANATDQDNIHKLLDALKSVPNQQRQAQFHCVIAFIRHADDPCPELFHGVWQGRILNQSQGEGGFGYDPVFYLDELHCTSAELPPVKKNQLSHRAKAMQQFLQFMQHHYEST